MKKLAAVALAAVLSFGCAVPAFAAGPHNGAGRCLNYSAFCQGLSQNMLTPTMQMMNERLDAVLAQVNGNGARVAGAGYGVGYDVQGNRQITAPGLCANGACGTNFVDADGDGVCDNYGTNCPNPNGGGNFVDADGDGVCDNYGTYRQGAGNGANGGAGYGGQRGAGMRGCYRR